MKNIWFSLFYLLCASSMMGQNLAFIADDKSGGEVQLQVWENIMKILESDPNLHITKYTTTNETLQVDTSFHSKNEETVADHLLQMSLKMNENLRPDLKINRDTSGKIKSVGFPLYTTVNYQIQCVDISSGQVSYFSNDTHYGDASKKQVFVAVDYNKYFKGDPEKLRRSKPKEYSNIIAKLYSDYRDRFKNYYLANQPKYDQVIVGAINLLEETPAYEITDFELEKNKLKRFNFDTEGRSLVNEKSFVRLLTIDTIGEYLVPENFGSYFIQSFDGNIFKAKNAPFNNSRPKEAAEAHLAGKPLFWSKSLFVAGKMKQDKSEPLRMSLKDMSMASLGSLGESITHAPSVDIIDAGTLPTIQLFQEHYKGNAFVDQYFEPKMLGADYVLSLTGENYLLQETKTGTTVGTVKKSYKQRPLYDLLQKHLGLKIEIVQATKQKKDKLQRALIYSPLGFPHGGNVDIVELVEETVNGQTLAREMKLGEGRIVWWKKSDENYTELNVKDGEKEIYAAWKAGRPILILHQLD